MNFNVYNIEYSIYSVVTEYSSIGCSKLFMAEVRTDGSKLFAVHRVHCKHVIYISIVICMHNNIQAGVNITCMCFNLNYWPHMLNSVLIEI